ncbi:hypothetical protein UFOVP908_148 [uncultured Caudovirales phage]|uniref:Uncharacterized protein n=1 Tax=uncultured Caudovirales phage TaxID=2100421 RepID=A0A6J7XFA4_9CAUD|nr:hypothetical protein UFOVP908_148 [uncultured Caudovirales phage]CAB4177170.1 hypothetical protein UFOVP990_221 [uncultured Caudovirales phage]CAB4181284.1 hypothetical protein UFOVP1065_19 [uncultured Caudovirales phage]CAB4190881.1 hypothetical protein UFOVP1198_221 [uncultured Caudovirales phage]CAB4211232.1 hypothetical protein UFOVP1418_213 [uncultured Caudovirales phage]
MSIKVSVNSSPGNRVSINSQNRDTIRTISVGIATGGGGGASILSELTDVRAVSPANNNTLVYDSATQKYVVRELPVLNGGTF